MLQTRPASDRFSAPAISSRSTAAEGGLAIALGTIVLTVRVAVLAGQEGRHFLLDDAFISFRYARNLANGVGLVFNEGERVEGYTNLLWTVLLSGAARLGLDIPSTSVVLAFLASVGTIVVLTAFGRALFAGRNDAPVLIAIAPLFFAVFGGQSRYVLSGMETSLFVMLITLGVYLTGGASRPIAAAVAFGAATLTRPEAFLYFVVALVFQAALSSHAAAARIRSAGWMLVAYAAVVLPSCLWRFVYYGTLLPNTFYVKSGAAMTPLIVRRGWTHLVHALQQSSVLYPAILAVPGIMFRPARHWWLIAGVALTAAAGMVLVGGDFQFFFGPRFLMPALPSLYLVAAAGLAAIADRLPVRAALRLAVVIGLTAILALHLGRTSWPGGDPALRYVASINRGWTELGRWLRANADPHAVIAVGAIGRIPYYSGHRTIDMLGIAEPRIGRKEIALGSGMPGHEKYDTPYVLSRHPDYVIFVLLRPDGYPAVQDWSLVADTFLQEYELVALVKASEAPGPWVLETYYWTPELAQRGYQAGVYRRRL